MKAFQKPLTAGEEKEKLERWKDGDLTARNILIERNMRLVAHVAKKYVADGREMDDLISIGTIGLIKAINTFDPEKNSKLATYAAKCIDNAILSQMRLWLRIDLLREKKNQNGVFLRKLPRICISFAPLRTVM